MILFLFGLPFASVGWFTLEKEIEYKTNGVQVEATVLSKKIETSTSSGNSHSSSYIVRYRFTPEGGTELESAGTVTRELYDSLEEGDPIAISYIAKEPTRSRAVQSGELTFGLVFICVGGVISLVGIGLLAFEIKARRLVARLMRDGMLVEAKIKSIEPGNLYINNVRQWRVAYSFRDMRGVEQSGLSGYLSPDDAQLYEAGGKAKVRYDKDNSSINILCAN